MKDVVAEIVFKPLIEKALLKFFVAFPALGFGPIGWFIKWVALKYATILVELLGQTLNMKLILFQNKELQAVYAGSQFELKSLAETHGENSEEFKNAKQRLKDIEYKIKNNEANKELESNNKELKIINENIESLNGDISTLNNELEKINIKKLKEDLQEEVNDVANTKIIIP